MHLQWVRFAQKTVPAEHLCVLLVVESHAELYK